MAKYANQHKLEEKQIKAAQSSEAESTGGSLGVTLGPALLDRLEEILL